MTHATYVSAVAVVAIGLAASGCGGSSQSTATKTETVTETTSAAPPRTAATSTQTSEGTGTADLAALIPTPANSQRTDGPDAVHEGGIHKHFLVAGGPADVMSAYKGALQGGGWTVSVENSGGGGGGGGATYTGTNGGAYGVFAGGGYGGTTDVDACVWPSKPADTNCGHDN